MSAEPRSSIIKVLSHSGSMEILFSLKHEPKRRKDLINKLKLDRGTTHKRLKELSSLGLIEEVPTHDKSRPKMYKLTPLGERIVKLIEKIQDTLDKNTSLPA